MIRVDNLSRRFNARWVLQDISLEIRSREIFVLIGPSGSGKTTLLRLIDLIDRPTTGSVTIDGRTTDGPEYDRREIRRHMAMVFQKPGVLNTTVAQNVAFGLEFRNVPGDEIRHRVTEALDTVGLFGFEGRRAVTLSGGEMQRVAIARALVTKPDILLMDEPTANLDPISSGIIEELIVRLNKESGTTILIATHDIAQGQRLAHRIAVMTDGKMVQAGEIADIFYHPVNRTVARFVGIEPVYGGVITSAENHLATIATGRVMVQAITPLPAGSRVALCIRPEEVVLSLPDTCQPATSARNCLSGTITDFMPYGPFTRVHVDCGIPLTALLTRRSFEELRLAAGTPVTATVKATAIHVIPD